MLSLPKHLGAAARLIRHDLTHVAQDLNNSTTPPREIRKNSFPRDSSASLGMTVRLVKTFCSE